MSKIDLSQFDEKYRSERTEGGLELEPLPDGNYEATVERVELGETLTGKPALRWDLRVAVGPYANRILRRNNVIADNTLQYLKKDLQTCGLELERLSDLPKHLDRLLDLRLAVTKRTRGDNFNVYLNKRLAGKAPLKAVKGLTEDSGVPF